MGRYILLFITALLLIGGCSIGPVYVVNYQPVVKIDADTTQIDFSVPDLDPDGWYYGDGVDSNVINIVLKETSGTTAYITDIEWTLVSETNPQISFNSIVMLNPLELKKSASDSISVVLKIEENDAANLDEADGINDNVGQGVFIIKVIYYDERANRYESLPHYIPVKATKP